MSESGWLGFTPSELKEAIKVVGARLRREGFNTMIIAPDDYWCSATETMCQTILVDSEAKSYMNCVAYHPYDNESNRWGPDRAISALTSIANNNLVKNSDLPLWQTEWCMNVAYGDKLRDWINTLKLALDSAKMIHNCHVYGNTSYFVIWTADYDWGYDVDGNGIMENEGIFGPGITKGKLKLKKCGHMLSQYTKYVRPGSKRIDVVLKGESNVFVTAYKEEGWQAQVEMTNKSKADAVEVVLACPGYGCFDERSQRVRTFPTLDIFPEIVEKATKFYVERSNKPVSVKLPPDYMNLMAPIEAAVRGGAQAIQFGDCPTLGSAIPPVIVDPDTRQVGLFPGAPYQGAMTQCMAVPYICGAMARARMRGVKVNLAGCGGVRYYKDVLRILMSGATSVQMATVVLVEGVGIAEEYLASLTEWMEAKGYKSIKDIQGLVLRDGGLQIEEDKFVAEVAQASGGPTPSLRTVVNPKRCINCGWCEQACPEMAIEIPDKLPIIDDNVCEVCGLCVALCPMKALAIEPRTS